MVYAAEDRIPNCTGFIPRKANRGNGKRSRSCKAPRCSMIPTKICTFHWADYPALMPHEECCRWTRNAAGAGYCGHYPGGTADLLCHYQLGPAQTLPSPEQLHSDAAKRNISTGLQPGDIIHCTATHIESFGVFCDVGCGISALLPIDCLSVSRIASPADRVQVGQQLTCVVRQRDDRGRLVLSMKELLGSWQQNADLFQGRHDSYGHCAQRGGLWSLYRADPQSCRTCGVHRHSLSGRCGQRVHQKYPASKDENQTGGAQQTGRATQLRSSLHSFHHRGTSG